MSTGLHLEARQAGHGLEESFGQVKRLERLCTIRNTGNVIFSDNLYFKIVPKVHPVLLKPVDYIYIHDEQSTLPWNFSQLGARWED